MNIFLRILSIVFLLMVIESKIDYAQTYVQGNQAGEWTKNKSPYVILANVTVPHTDTLTIDPGVVVKLSKGTNLNISGTLIAEGTESDSILFTSAEPNVAPGDWGSLIFDWQTVNTASFLDYAIIEYGGGNSGASGLVWDTYEIHINHSLIQYNTEGLYVGSYYDTALSTISNSIIKENTGYGYQGGTTIISNVQFINNSGYYSGNGGGGITFYNCTFKGNTPSAFQSTSSGAKTSFINCIIINNTAGIGSSYSNNTLNVDSCVISNNNGYGINMNTLYGSGTLQIYNSVIENNQGDGITNPSQHSIIQGNDIIGNTGGITNILGDTSMVIRNNIIMNNSGEGISLQKYSPPSIRFNDVFNNQNDFQGLSAFFGDTALAVNKNGTPSDLYSNIRRDPLFVSLSSSDFHLTKNSPCINAGDTLLKDSDGSISDIGAFTTSTVPLYAAKILLSSKVISFGSIEAGKTKDTSLVILSNGNDTLKISNITSTNNSFTTKTNF